MVIQDIYKGRRIEMLAPDRARVEDPNDPTTTDTFDLRPDGSWEAWYTSTYGNGHFLQKPYQAEPGLATRLSEASKLF